MYMYAFILCVSVCVYTVTSVSASPPVLLLQRGDSSRKPLNVKENSALHGKHPAERRDGKVGGRSLPSEYRGIPRSEFRAPISWAFLYKLHRVIVAVWIPSVSQRLTFSTGWEASGRKSLTTTQQLPFRLESWVSDLCYCGGRLG